MREVIGFFATFLGPEKSFVSLAAVYGLAISLLSLALPISVQTLINSVANTNLLTPLIVLTVTLFGFLLASALLNALRLHLLEIFGRRFYARMISEIALRTIYAKNPFFADNGKSPLFNRYFDIITVQKSVPYLLIGGYTVALQALVGFVVVSFYHPLFFVFIIFCSFCILLILGVLAPSTIRAGIVLSHVKHANAAWLQDLAGSNGFYQSERHIGQALDRTDKAAEAYFAAHKRFFRRNFTQTLLLYILYAVASAALLGIGGWLVIQGQLSLGQLVAAELILSAAFAGIAQLGSYLGSFYDLCAALEELSLFRAVALDGPVSAALPPARRDSSLEFRSVTGVAETGKVVLDFALPSGTRAMAKAADHGVQRLISSLLKRHADPDSGVIVFGGADILSTDVYSLRQEVRIIDRSPIVPMSMREYLTLSAAEPDSGEMLRMLEVVGLDQSIERGQSALDRPLAATGWPLSVAETMALKLAGALLARPRLLILNQLADLIPEEAIERAAREMSRLPDMTVLYFTNRTKLLGFDEFLVLGQTRQTLVATSEDMHALPVRAPQEQGATLLGISPIPGRI